MTARRSTPAVALVAALVVGGCSGPQLTVHPDPPPNPGTWAAVTLAAAGAAVVLGLLATLPAWRDRRERRWLAMLLGVQTGALLVTAAVTAGAAVRSQQLTERPPDELPVVALLELSAIGDGGFAELILVGAVLFLVLPAVVTGLTAGLVASHGAGERWLACLVLALQAGAGLLAAGRLVLGDSSLLVWALTVNGPLAVLGIVACWPLRSAAPTPPTRIGSAPATGPPAPTHS